MLRRQVNATANNIVSSFILAREHRLETFIINSNSRHPITRPSIIYSNPLFTSKKLFFGKHRNIEPEKIFIGRDSRWMNVWRDTKRIIITTRRSRPLRPHRSPKT